MWVGRWTILLILCPPILPVIRLQTPDGLALALVASGLFVFLRGRKIPGALLLALSVFSRPDCIVFVGIMLAGFAATKQLRIPAFIGTSVFALAEYFLANRHGYSWAVWFHRFPDGYINNPAEVSLTVTPHMYLTLAAKGILALESSNLLFLLVLLAGAVAWKLNRETEYRTLLICCLASCLIRFAIMPSFITRLFAPMLLVPLICLVRAADVREIMKTRRSGNEGVREELLSDRAA